MSPHKKHFRHFLGRAGKRLHFAAHSHHYWPDATRAAQAQVWEDAAEGVDQKWDRIFSEVIPEVQGQIAAELKLSDPSRIAFASNTHSFVLRLLSSLPAGAPLRILSSDSEFLSFSRQMERLVEAGRIQWEQIPCEPFESFEQRFVERAGHDEHELVFVSQVFFNSGFVFEGLQALAQAMAASEALLVVDGYHGFMAIPTDLSAVEERLFYMAGGYKYAMSGEGICFLHCPDGYAQRPTDTGWFASFGELESAADETRVGYGAKGQRFWGATMDPSGFYRMQAVFGWLDKEGLSVTEMQRYVRDLQSYFLDKLSAGQLPWLRLEDLVPGPGAKTRGRFLTFRSPQAAEIHARLSAADVTTDYRGHNLRLGFGIYQNLADVDELCRRMQDA